MQQLFLYLKQKNPLQTNRSGPLTVGKHTYSTAEKPTPITSQGIIAGSNTIRIKYTSEYSFYSTTIATTTP